MNNVSEQWVTLGAARDISGMSQRAIQKAAARGEIRTLAERGSFARYRRADVLHLAGIIRRD